MKLIDRIKNIFKKKEKDIKMDTNNVNNIVIDFEKTIKKVASPNFHNVDRNGNIWNISPRFIVIHWTAGLYDPSVKWLCNPQAQVSAHFVIDSLGLNIAQLVALNKRAWHCGGSWHPAMLTDTNADSIGIECEGPPSMIKAEGWNSDFIDILAKLCIYIKTKVPTIIGVVDHSTIMPHQKSDVKKGTGIDLFPWNDFVTKTGLMDYTIEPYASQIKQHFGVK